MPSASKSVIFLAVITSLFCVETAVAKTKKPPAQAPQHIVNFDSNAFTHDAVVSTVSDVFTAHGYKPELGRQQGMQMGPNGTATAFEEGPIIFVSSDLQPAAAGSGSKPWFYRAIVKDGNIELQVFVHCTANCGFFDNDLTNWEPADLNLILQELQKRLQVAAPPALPQK